MIWLNPWAWAGAAAIALPVLIHLLGRAHARAHRFPSLRFLEASRLLPTRRTRIHDPLLLIVRCATIVLAAAALARPLLLTHERRQTLDRGLARAIVIDTSASMRRRTPSGGIAIDSARHNAAALGASAPRNVTIETNAPSRALDPAIAWLEQQGGRSELVVVSDFQRGTLDAGDFASVPEGTGITLRRVPTVVPPLELAASAGGIRIAARATIAGERTDAEWTRVAGVTSDATILLGADQDVPGVDATRVAAAAIATVLPQDTSRAIAIVFRNYPNRAALLASATPVHATWMLDLLAELRRDSVRINASGVGAVNGRSRLILSVDDDPGSLSAAIAAVDANRATSVAPAPSELEPEVLSDAELGAMQRPTSDNVKPDVGKADGEGPSDGRWLWIATLVLLLIEIPLRRNRTIDDVASARERRRAA